MRRKNHRFGIQVYCVGIVAMYLAVVARAGTLAVPGQYPTIQAAINAAQPNDTVLVADGVYTGAGNRDLDFHGKAITVRSASGEPNSCVIDCQGSAPDRHRAFYFHSGETNASVVEGFTITNGYWAAGQGGGAYCVFGSSPTFRRCTFSHNKAEWWAGAIYNNGGDLNVSDCTFSDNAADPHGGGGAIGNDLGGGRRVYTNCTFLRNISANASTNGGGAIISVAGEDVLLNCYFEENRSDNIGGAVWFVAANRATVTDCTFVRNFAPTGGAAAVSRDSNGTLTNCLFAANQSSGTSNQAAALWVGDGLGGPAHANIVNCTFSKNVAPTGGAALIVTQTSDASVANCVFWSDTPAEIVLTESATIDVSYSNVQGGWTGTGNIDADPLFADSNASDYHLQAASPCIDTGDPAFVPALGETDLDGHLRVWDGHDTGTPIVDMGAYEYGSHPYGDLNCDGQINFGDIDAFVLALTDPAAYHAAYPACNYLLADSNSDGVVNFADIDPFVALLGG